MGIVIGPKTKSAITFINVFNAMHQYGLRHGCMVPLSAELREELMSCAAIVRKHLAHLSSFERAQAGPAAMVERLRVVDELCAD
jgi:hypothetical protein